MNPLLLALLSSFGPGLISSLFGNSQQKYRHEVSKIQSSLPGLTAQQYQQIISSPAFAQGQGVIAAGANQASNNVAANLAQRGLGTTGTGAILSGLTPSLVGSQTASLRTAAHQTATDTAMQQIQQQLAALTGSQGPSQTQQYFAGGINALAPLLQMWLKQRMTPGVASPITGNGAGYGGFTGGPNLNLNFGNP